MKTFIIFEKVRIYRTNTITVQAESQTEALNKYRDGDFEEIDYNDDIDWESAEIEDIIEDED
jgi:hypothetical protein